MHCFEVYKITNIKYSQNTYLLSDIIKMSSNILWYKVIAYIIEISLIQQFFRYIESTSHLTYLKLLLTINSSQKYFNF
jgi:hypothetical protein